MSQPKFEAGTSQVQISRVTERANLIGLIYLLNLFLVDKCIHFPNATFYSCLLYYLHSSITCFGLTRPPSGVITLNKIVALSLQFSLMWNALLLSIKIHKMLVPADCHQRALPILCDMLVSLLAECFWLCM
jgi:hypothetical protein